MHYLLHMGNLSRKDALFLFRIQNNIIKRYLAKGHKVAQWTPSIKSASQLLQQVRKAQERKRLKRKHQNS